MDWTTLAIQIPLVAAFIWFSLEMQERFMETLDKREKSYQDSLDKRDQKYLETLDKVSTKLDTLEDKINQLVIKRIGSHD